MSALSRWNADAACIGHDPDLWFPTDGRDVELPVSICVDECAVRIQCLDYAVQTRQRYGIWGGVPLDGAAARTLAPGGPVATAAGLFDLA